jgi:cytochrome c biogenesis protein CcdA
MDSAEVYIAIKRVMFRNRISGIVTLLSGIGILTLALLIALADFNIVLLWVIGVIGVFSGIVFVLTASVDEADVEVLRMKAEKSKMHGNYKRADKLFMEAKELERALNA